MRLSAFVGQELANVPLVEVSARSWPFDLVAPLAAWFWVDTGFRAAADGAFAELKSLEFEATIACGCLDDVSLKADERLLGNAYHRALLELVAPIHPRWQLGCNDLGQLCCSGPRGLRAEGQQFGMLQVFPDARVLANHFEINVVQLADASESVRTRHELSKPHLVRRHGWAPTQGR
jgi:hypothetical protein